MLWWLFQIGFFTHADWSRWRSAVLRSNWRIILPHANCFIVKKHFWKKGPGCGTVSLHRSETTYSYCAFLLILWLFYHQGQVFSHCWGSDVLYYGDYFISVTPVTTFPELPHFCCSYKSTYLAGFYLTMSPSLSQTVHVLYDFLPEFHPTFFQNKFSMAPSFQDGWSWTLSIPPGFLSLYSLIYLIISARRTELISAVGYLYFKSFSSQYLTDPFLCLLPVCLVFEAFHLTFICCQHNFLLPYLCSEICCCTHRDKIMCFLLKLKLSKDNQQQHSITQGRVPRISYKWDIKKLFLWEKG